MKRQNEQSPASQIAQLEKELTANAVELKRKNRDLEIEASLERVRAVAMGMNKSDDLLSICETMFHELKKLSFDDLRNAMIDIHYEEKAYLLNYDYSDNAGKTITTFKYNTHPIVDNLIYHAKQSSESFTEMVYSGKALDEWKIFRKQNGEADDARLENIDALYYYFYSIGTGAIGISTFSAANPEQLNVLKRFRNVFDLAYRRYTDIQLAEDQAREAQIELALERVRARTMAMQHSDELVDAAAILFKQVKDLSVEVWTCGFQIWKPGEPGTTVAYMTLPDGTIRVPFDIPHPPEPFLNRAYQAAQRGDQFYVEEIGGEALAAHYKYMLALPGSSDRMVDISAGGFHLPGFQVNHNAYFSQGALLFITYKPVPQSWDIFKRFAKVFEQTYTRFLDLKKAEAQAREALIEGALERVRSRAMAMHKTDELRDAAELLYKELTGLGISTLTVCYVLVNAENKTGLFYGINPVDGQVTPPTVVPHTETEVMRAMWASWLKQEPVCFMPMDPEASIAHQTYVGNLMAASFKSHGINFGFTVEHFLSLSPERLHVYSLNFKQGYLFLVRATPLAAADVDILIRFTKVFELTYTRFLDIQKAEAQAREGRIELALERVRARTMAMQHSDELAETAYILFQQFRDLGENPDQATIGIINEAEGVIEYWVTIYGNQTNRVFKFPIEEPNVTNKIYKAWKAQEKSLVIDLGGQALFDFSKFRESMGGAGFNPDEKRRVINVAFFSKGLINVQSTVERSAESMRLLERFANVFEGTYTRFLDLKKAEAQAREGQIELALERVRARAMAMRDSKELSSMVSTVFSELTKLDFSLTRCAIVIADSESGSWMIWMANSEAGQLPISFYRKSLDHPYPNAASEEWKKRTPKWVYHLKGAEKKGMDDYYANSEEVAHMSNEIRQAMGTPDSIILSHSFNNFGYLRADSLEFLSEANLDILYRFAKVFDLGYTRFTDIKQAEAQAREAQIELALERVRAKTMAMQHSDELLETSQVVFQQLRDLGETADQISIAIVKEDEGIFDLFATIYGTQMVRVVHPKIDDHYVMGRVYKNWKAHKRSFVVELGGEELRRYNILRNQLGGVDYYNEVIGPDDRWIVSAACFSNGILSFSSSTEPTKEAALLLERFAKVFDSTYTRFLDLQKAEAQARESQIQLALERVRARTMAMQRSEELPETANLLFTQVQELGMPAWSAGYCNWTDNKKAITFWMSSEGVLQPPFSMPTTEDPSSIHMREAAERGETFYVEEVGGETLVKHYEYMRTLPVVGEVLDSIINAGHPLPTFQIFHLAYFAHGFLLFITYEPVPEAHEIFKRFARVFEQTYTRFLDLQKAETQARESQVQLALERIRARTMAMQKSDELAETVSLLFKQLLDLGIRQEQIRTCGIVTFDDNEPIGEQWVTETNGEVIPQSFRVPYTEIPAYISIYESWKKGEKFKIIHLQGELLKQHFRYLDKHANVPIRDVVARRQANEIYNHVLFFSQGYLFIITKEALPGYHDVFKRFGAVFQQSYTRFLDLKKAEAQAREGQIQLAMERVRARTMAMQRSDELMEASHLLDSQVRALGIRTRGCAFNIYGENESTEWFGLETGPLVYKTPREEAFLIYYEAGQRGDSLYINEFAGDACKAHYEYLCTLPDVGDALKKMRDNGQPFPAYQIDHVVYFKFGYLLFITFEPVPEAHDIFKRFAAVFEQTYTRFLDLQKAEEQARESQIEAALERVRSRSMGMQKSDELEDVIQIIYEQFVHLNISIEHTGFVVDYRAGDDWHFWIADHLGSPNKLTIPDFDSAWCNDFNAAKEKGIDFFATNLTFDEKNKFYRDLFERAPGMPQEAKELIFSKPGFAGSTVLLENVALYIENFEGIPYTDAENATLMRFGKVFQQTYTRFLDLQRAEEQAREARIEAALERTRTQSMIMQHSGELDDTLRVFHEQVLHLGIGSAFSFLWLPDEEKDRHIFWAAWAENASKTFKSKAIDYQLDRNEPATAQCLVDWKGTDPVVSYHVPPGDVKNYFAAWQELIDGVQHLKPKYFSGGLYYVEAFVKYGCFGVIVKSPLTEEEKKILGRLAIEFERTYTRFLDLKKAEAQAREAKIEAALEKIRSRSLAMHQSVELLEVVTVVFEKLQELEVPVTSAGINIYIEGSKDADVYVCGQNENGLIISSYRLPFFDHPIEHDMFNGWQKGLDFLVKTYPFKEKNSFYSYLFDHSDLKYLPGNIKDLILQSGDYTLSMAFSKNSMIVINHFDGKLLSEMEIDIIKRFAKVFEQAYVRFLDLQKAEAQAREGQIEAALERVRSRTMSMHNSQDVGDTIVTLFDELTRLGFTTLRCSVDILNDTQVMEIWTAKPGKNEKADLVIGHLDTALHPMLGAMYNAWKAKKPDFFYELAGDDQARYLTALNEYAGYAINYEIASMPARQFLNAFFFADGGILAWTAEPLHAEASLILTRFASVFGQTYRRYLDLQKAETQAREAQIEMALERVRAVAMSMRKPGELLEISQTIFTQLKALDFAGLRNTEIIINSDEKESVISYYYSDYGVTGIIEVFFNEHPTVKAWANEMRKANDAFTEMVIPEDEIAAWRKYREEIGYRPDPKLDEAKEVFYYSYSIGLGGLSISSFTPIKDDQKKILERFRNVFNLSYQRYADIARAEEQAREAIKQASLDRVRAEIASMRTTGDLERITPLVWDELTILGIPFIRCGVFIVDEAEEVIHTHLSTPDGRALAAFDLHFDADGIGQNVLAAWRKKQSAVIHWTAEEFAASTKSQVERGAVKARERFVTEHPDTSLDLHFFPFLQGMLYVGNIEPLNDDARDLVQSLAEAFSTAYARYEDFNKLEAAKQQVDKTLTDLKAAQTQLIQTEKMASLGELTAGIAHEIQNPLNFVNNFSEVNAELIEEMKGEIEKGDLEEIRALALDIEANSKKINQHGKRADGIVKGMLQHSQSGSGVKELININTVADEYMRLAYHGLRAKDKSFNAEMHSHFDPALPKINVIPQDIGRVLLNLFNNAFYAVNQKMKTAGGDYKPMVEVETFFLPAQAVGGLKVKDNGIGIPDAIKEKIMQPFFTTKPTGEGTGLGLSLTYDMVVKGHGGSIQVNSVEGEGSEFIIKLPIS